ncbi:MAG TPA: AI-2E family transporter [Pyrinomonadaceae bacterium]|nr:AI-2E family transporter [Pyrinomonadaceae bacterium]
MTADKKDTKRLVELTVGDAKRALIYAAAVLAAAALFVVLVGQVLVALLLGVVAGVYLLPVQEWLEQRLRRRAGSALITMALIIVPLAALFGYGWYELYGYSEVVFERKDEIADSISRSLSKYLPVRYEDARASLQAAFTAAVVGAAKAFEELQEKSALIFTAATLFFFTVYYVLTRRLSLAHYIKLRVPGDFLPLYEKLTENVGGALRGAVWAVLIDQTLKAVIIFVCNLAFGVPLAVALALAAFITGFFPLLGVWVVYIPVSIYLLVFRDAPTAAAIYFSIGTAVTITSSLFLRPALAASQTRSFNFYWMLVALISGVFTFGIPGIVLGPAILGFAKAVMDTLVGEVRYETSLLKEEKEQEAQRQEDEEAEVADEEAEVSEATK